MKKPFLRFIALSLCCLPVFLPAQTTFRLVEQLQWETSDQSIRQGSQEWQVRKFKGGVVGEQYPDVPLFVRTLRLPAHGLLDVQLVRGNYSDLEREAGPGDALVGEALEFHTRIDRDRNGYYGIVEFVPIIKTGMRYRKL
ncbi:MAG: hypothetical protein KDD04_11955, partial [Sinomicrobium sp.]|nr:hypothetical protein [Sinomicrobium sp.]